MVDYTITVLDISRYGLTKLPVDIDKYTNLKELHCIGNKITSLDNLPSKLEVLICHENLLIYDFESTLENIRNYNTSRILSS